MADCPDSKQWRALQPTRRRQTRAAASDSRLGHLRHAIDSTPSECPQSGTKTPAKRREKKFCEDGLFHLMASEIRNAEPTLVIRRSARAAILATGVARNSSANGVPTARLGREFRARKLSGHVADPGASRAIDASQPKGSGSEPECSRTDPHHRTRASAYGGPRVTLKRPASVGQGDPPQPAEVDVRIRLMRAAAAAVPQRALPVVTRAPSPRLCRPRLRSIAVRR